MTFHPGDRIAQLVIQRYVEAKFIEAETLPGSDRAEAWVWFHRRGFLELNALA